MNNKTLIFILGIYTSVCVSIVGYFYINPTENRILSGSENLNWLDYTNFKYSILISIVGLILLFSFLQLFRKSKIKMHHVKSAKFA